MTRHATPTDALAAALRVADPINLDGYTRWLAERSMPALAEAGYTIVRSDDLLEIAGIAGADLSGIDHAGQLVHPPLLDYVATEVRALRQSYDECLKECE